MTTGKPFKGFFPLNSPEGQRILNGLKHIDTDQPDLFEGME